MKHLAQSLQIQSSPHVHGTTGVADIMRNVVYALLPVCAFSIYVFGLAALVMILVSVTVCVATEHLLCRWSGKASSVSDYSATVTGILFALTLPPGLPLWMVACGGAIGVAIGKSLFGGLGYNAFNPALVGRAILQAAFPSAMTTWQTPMLAERFTSLPSSMLTMPFMKPDYGTNLDATTAATPLANMKFEAQATATSDLFLGVTGGSLGETSALFILLGGAWLIARNMMNWRIPASIFLTVALLSTLFHQIDPVSYPSAFFALGAGGLMLGAVFMATDMVASPMTAKGLWIYGFVIGALVLAIRYWGGLPEGVMYAILLANALSPHIDAATQPKVFGSQASNGDNHG